MHSADSIENQVIQCLITALALEDKAKIGIDTALLGNLPEFDSQSVVSILVSLEEEFDIVIEDDEVDADLFQTAGSLAAFVKQKLAEGA